MREEYNDAEARARDLELQLEQRSTFEHAVIVKLEELTERHGQQEEKLTEVTEHRDLLLKENASL